MDDKLFHENSIFWQAQTNFQGSDPVKSSPV